MVMSIGSASRHGSDLRQSDNPDSSDAPKRSGLRGARDCMAVGLPEGSAFCGLDGWLDSRETGRMALGWKLVIDSTNAPALADFWAAALEYEVEDSSAPPLATHVMGAGIEVAEPPRLLGCVRLQDVHDGALMERDVRTRWLVKGGVRLERGGMALVTVGPSIV